MNVNDIAPQRRRNTETGGVDAENAFIAGITRSGKTYLAKQLAMRDRWGLVHDAKGSFTFPGGVAYRRVTSINDLYDLDPKDAPRIVYSPNRFELRDEGAQDAFFEFAYHRHAHETLVIDELTKVCSSRRILPHLADCYSRGNEFGLSVVGLSQEPVNVHSVPISQATHLYCFYLAIASHREKMQGVMPIETDEIAALNPRAHNFLYWRVDERDAIGPLRIRPARPGKALDVAQR